MRHVQYQNPGCNYNPISPTNPGIYVYGQAPMGGYSIQNYGVPAVGSIPPQIMSPIGNQEQQQPIDSAVQGRESLGHVTISGPSMVSISLKKKEI